MRITAELMQSRKIERIELPSGATGLDLLRQLHLAPEAHLVIRGDSPMPLDERLADEEHVSILSVVSGGL